jgi:tetratricopeptide (TPR) repeat protein
MAPRRWLPRATGVLLCAALALASVGCARGVRLAAAGPTAAAASSATAVPPTHTPLPTFTATATPSPTPSRTPSATPSATATPSPTAAPTATARPSPTGTPSYPPAAPEVELRGFTRVWQTWNNCGPATLVMLLSHYGLQLSQEEARLVIRPNPLDKHAGTTELVAYARAQGLQAVARVNGSDEEAKLLLTSGIPVMVNTWHVDEKGLQMGHYRLLTGYSDARQEWIVHDVYETRGMISADPYRGIAMGYDELARLWEVTNHTYLLVWNEAQAQAVREIVGQDLDDATMWRRALERAQAEVQRRPGDAFAWFTLGSNLVGNGQWADAATAFERAQAIGLPPLMLWYQFGPFRAYYELGRIADLLALVDETLARSQEVEELHYWRGMGLRAQGDLAGARQEFERALAQRPSYAEAAAALAALPGP